MESIALRCILRYGAPILIDMRSEVESAPRVCIEMTLVHAQYRRSYMQHRNSCKAPPQKWGMAVVGHIRESLHHILLCPDILRQSLGSST